MKLGDIKVEAIKLMFTNYAFDMGINDLQTLISDENYGSYIVNMNGSISRALDRIENACVVPVKSYTINEEDLEHGRFLNKFDLTKIEDLFMVDRVTAEYKSGLYDGSLNYELQGDTLILPNISATLTILYFPKIKTVNEQTSDSDEIWIPENIARLIPYFIKGDLYQEEEPVLAADARNLFEASLDDLKAKAQNKQNHVQKVLRM